jgi:hypothetical protein
MAFIERLSLKERFSSPAALALFGAFAVPEPFGTIILAYAAFWWWRSRKKQTAQLADANAPLLAAKISQHEIDRRLFDLRRHRAECGVEPAANAVYGGDDHDGNTGGNNGVFDRRRRGLILHKCP